MFAIALPKIAILATGGTIAGRGADPARATEYRAGSIGVEELLEAVPQLSDLAEILPEQFANVPSSALAIADLLRLARRLNELLASDEVQGAVITHGTDVLEESAYFLNLTVKSHKPVIVTGSMRPATAISADGPMNIIQAVRVASHPDSCGKGVLVVLNDEIHAARDVTKSHAQRVQTFISREFGPLGIISGAHVEYYRQSLRQHTLATPFQVAELESLPRVDLVTTHLGSDSLLIDAAIAGGAKGLVVAAAGGGALTPAMREGIQRGVAAGLQVVFTTRTGAGTVGVGRRGAEQPIVGAGNLNPYKALMLLALCLAYSDQTGQIQEWFDRF